MERGLVDLSEEILRTSSPGPKAVICAAIAVFSLVACNRTPPEPAPAASVQAQPIAREAEPRKNAASRCITSLAKEAPSIPPPAPLGMCPADPEANLKMPIAGVSFPDAPGAPQIEIELAQTAHDVERGLMYRRSMGDDHGMLFRLDGRRNHEFWMHNTCIALDMIFIDEDGVIVGVVEGAAPLTESTRSVGCPSVYVLEVNGGWVRKRGVVPGQRIELGQALR